MNKFRIENLLLLFICILAIALVAWPPFIERSSLDIHIYDTYFVFGGSAIASFLLGYCFLLFALYKVLRHKLRRVHFTMAFIHIAVTVLYIVYCYLFADFRTPAAPTRYLDYAAWNKPLYRSSFFIATLLFVAIQIIFFVYFFAQYFFGKKDTFLKENTNPNATPVH